MVSPSNRVFFERFNRLVISRARTLLGDGDAAEDAMQDVFVHVLTTESRLLDDPAPQGWLYRVTTNICFNRLRDERRRRELLATDDDGTHARDDRSPETRAMLRQLLDALPREMQTVAVLHYLDEMTYDEIARRVGVSRRTVGARLLTLRRRLARLTMTKPAYESTVPELRSPPLLRLVTNRSPSKP